MSKIHFKEGQSWPKFEKKVGEKTFATATLQVKPGTSDANLKKVITDLGYADPDKIGFHRLAGSESSNVIHSGKLQDCPYCKRSGKKATNAPKNTQQQEEVKLPIPELKVEAPVDKVKSDAPAEVPNQKIGVLQKAVSKLSDALMSKYSPHELPDREEGTMRVLLTKKGEEVAYVYDGKGTWKKSKSNNKPKEAKK